MSEIRYGQASTTFSYVLAAGLVAMYLAQDAQAQIPKEHFDKSLLQTPYLLGDGRTFSSYSNPITGEYNIAPENFEQAVGKFYAKLLGGQEPLGAEFEKVLYDNLWDLYERASCKTPSHEVLRHTIGLTEADFCF